MSFQVMAWAVKQQTGSGTDKAILLMLANNANSKTGRCDPHIETLAQETEFGRATVQRSLTRLVDGGFITRYRKRRKDGSLGGYVYEFPRAEEVSERDDQISERDLGLDIRVIPQEPGREDLNPKAEIHTVSPAQRADFYDQTAVREEWHRHPGLVQHRDAYYDKTIRRKIARAAAKYGISDVVKAIESYAAVLASPNHFFDYRWTLGDFLTRGLDRFVPEADPWRNFRTTGKPGKLTPYEIAHQFDHLGEETDEPAGDRPLGRSDQRDLPALEPGPGDRRRLPPAPARPRRDDGA